MANAQLSTTSRTILLVLYGGCAIVGAAIGVVGALRFRSVTDPRAWLWYGFASCLTLAGWVGLRLKPKWGLGLALAGGSTALTLIAAEWAVETIEARHRANISNAVEALTGNTFDRRSIPQVVNDLRASDPEAVPSIVPKVLLNALPPGGEGFAANFLPLAGVSHSQTVQLCNEDGRHQLYLSDRYGFNNPDSAWDETGPRLVLIGDSFTHGYCVPSDSTLASQLRESWPAVINLGTGGSGPLSELGTLVEYGSTSNPALLLWLYHENDLSDAASEQASPLLLRYLEQGAGQGLVTKQERTDSVLRMWIDEVYAGPDPRDPMEPATGLKPLLTLWSLRSILSRAIASAPPDPRRELPLFQRALERASSVADSLGAPLIMVFLPEWERYFAPERQAFDMARPEVLAIAKRLRIPVIDLTDRIAKHPHREALFARRDVMNSHYSSDGYRLVSDVIIRSLDSLQLLPRDCGAGSGTRATGAGCSSHRDGGE